MLKKLKNFWDNLCKNGIKFPFAHDTDTGKPSITLLFPAISVIMLILSLIVLHFKPTVIIATGATFMFWVVSTIFYMMRRIHKANFDFDDNSVSLEGGDPPKKKNKNDSDIEYYYEDEDK